MNPHGEKAKYWPRLRESNKDGLDLRSARPMNNIHLPGLFCQEKDQDQDQMLNLTPPASRTKSNDRIGMQRYFSATTITTKFEPDQSQFK